MRAQLKIYIIILNKEGKMMNNKKTVIGTFLILLGAITGLGNLNIISGHITLIVISAALLFAYFITGAWNNKASIGFLIPGLIMGSISIFTIIEENSLIQNSNNDGFIFLMLLGASFLLIILIHTSKFKNISWGEKYWPIFPGGILMMIGILGLSFGENRRIWALVNPMILIAIGVFIIIKPYLKSNNHKYGNSSNNEVEMPYFTTTPNSTEGTTADAVVGNNDKVNLNKENI
jgi:phosphatidylserine synthase